MYPGDTLEQVFCVVPNKGNYMQLTNIPSDIFTQHFINFEDRDFKIYLGKLETISCVLCKFQPILFSHC